MKPEIEKLSTAYGDAESKLKRALEKLPRYGEDCQCGWEDNEGEIEEEPEGMLFIHFGNWPEMVEICLNCGGVIQQ